MRAAAYLRVSTDQQAQKGLSLPEQQAAISAYCEANGLEVVAVISDDFTGRVASRPGMTALRRLAEEGGIDVVVAVRVDRLARKAGLGLRIEEELENLGVAVRYVEQQFDPSPSGRLHRGMVGVVTEFEVDLLRERTMQHRRAKAVTRGAMPCGNAPFGYRIVTRAEEQAIPEFAGRSGELLAVPAEAAAVERVFALILSGLSLRKVAARLHEEGIPTRKGGAWSAWTVRSIVENEAYIGRHWFGRRRCRLLDKGEQKHIEIKPAPRADWVAIPCPPLISEAVFYAANQRLQENRQRLSGRPSYQWPLRGAVVCGHCLTRQGTPRHAAGNGRSTPAGIYRMYYCPNRWDAIPERRCSARAPALMLEALALKALEKAALPGLLAEQAMAEAARALAKHGPALDNLARLREALAELEAEEERIADLILSGLPRAVVDKKVAALAERRRRLEAQLGAARVRSGGSEAPQAAGEAAEAAAEWLRGIVPRLAEDPALFRQVAALFLEVRIYRNKRVRTVVRVPMALPSEL